MHIRITCRKNPIPKANNEFMNPRVLWVHYSINELVILNFLPLSFREKPEESKQNKDAEECDSINTKQTAHTAQITILYRYMAISLAKEIRIVSIRL